MFERLTTRSMPNFLAIFLLLLPPKKKKKEIKITNSILYLIQAPAGITETNESHIKFLIITQFQNMFNKSLLFTLTNLQLLLFRQDLTTQSRLVSISQSSNLFLQMLGLVMYLYTWPTFTAHYFYK